MRSIDLLIVFALLHPLAAQDSGLGVPVMGYTADTRSGVIRPIRGLPGAALVREPLNVGFRIRTAAISPLHDFALVVSVDDSRLHLISLRGEIAPLLPQNTIDSPDAIILSPSGKAAILYQQDAGIAQVLTQLPDGPEAQPPVTLPFVLPSSSLAIADDGILLAPGMDSTWPAGVSAVSVRRNSHDLLAATRSGDIYLARNVMGAPEFRKIYAAGENGSEPVAIQFSIDGAYAYSASVNGTVAIIDLSTNETRILSCDCRPDGLQSLADGKLFRLRGTSGPLLLLDVSGREPRFWFVPPHRDAGDSMGGGQ